MPAETLASLATNVTCTLTDSNDSLWAGARVVVTFVAPPNTAAPYLFNGQPFQLKYRFDNVGASGSFDVELPPNIDITPEGIRSLWRFDVGPNWDDNTSVSFMTQVAGPAMDLSPTFKSASEVLIRSWVQSMAVPRADADADVIVAPNEGQMFFNTGEKVMKFWADDQWNVFGAVGDQGPIGPTGPQGATGPTGPQGPTGSTGPAGPTGPKGETGAGVTILGNYDTYEELVAAHPTGNMGDAWLVGPDLYVWNGSQWYNVGTIQGPQGEPGATGATGPQGIQGNPGTTGPAGSTGPQGPAGATGATGPQGPIGNTGPQGVPGTNGTNGADGAIGPPGPTIFPPAGVAVSTGSAWGTSIPANDVVRASSLSTVFAGTIAAPTINIVNDAQMTGTVSLLNAYTNNLGIGSITSFFLGRDQNPLNYIQLGFQFMGSGNPANIGIVGFPGGSQATFDNSGNWNIPGILTAGVVHTMTYNIGSIGQLWTNNNQVFLDANGYQVVVNYNRGNPGGGMQIYGSTGVTGDVNISGGISCGGDVGVGGQVWTNSITSGANALSVNAITTFNSDIHVGGTVYTGWDISVGRNLYVTADLQVFGTVYGSWDINAARNVNVTGDLNVYGGKNFVTNHPLKPDMKLYHGSLEGPEYAVFYRGEAATQNGVVEITLPDYFEALTYEEDRTVQLTELIEDEDNPMFGCFLATTKVKNGKFKVRSSVDVAKFYWEVKAVRKDIPKLVVERPKEEVANATGSK